MGRSKPDGTPKKQLNVDKLKRLGWTASKPLHRGIQETVQSFKEDFGKSLVRL